MGDSRSAITQPDTGETARSELVDARHTRVTEKILAAATRTLTSNARASLTDIAREAEIGRTTLHRYFPTRDALIAAIAARALERLDAVIAATDFDRPFAEALTRLIADCLPLGPEMVFVGNHPDAWVSGDPEARYEHFSAQLAAAAERAQERGEVRPEVPPWWIAELIMLNLWGAWYVVSGGYVGPRAIPGLIMDTLLGGIAVPRQTDPPGTAAPADRHTLPIPR